MAHHEIEKVANRNRDEQTYQESDGWRHPCREHVENNQLTLMVGDADQQEALPDKDIATQLLRPDQRRIENVAGEHLHDHDDDDGQHGRAGDEPHGVSVPHQDKRPISAAVASFVCMRASRRAAAEELGKMRPPEGGRDCSDQAVAWAAATNSAISGDFLVHSPMIGATFAFIAGRSSRGANCTPFFFRSSRAAKS